jgi:UDP-N-acetylmuramate: L-alanyl-gamma-D-glutamyl-meso-diaminopimelate ligase
MIDPSRVRRLHLIAVCGTGMAALAAMLKAAGFSVTGSDANVYPPMSTLLDRLGIPCHNGFDPANIPPDVDAVVIGNAVSKTNPEVAQVLARGIPYLSFPQALAEFFLKDRVPLVIVGTHGKTTTSALAAWVLDAAGLDPGFLIGGWALNFEANSRLGGGRYFVVEGDEYDTAFFDKGPKFMHYRPFGGILTSIEFDHADIYQDLNQVKEAFAAFARLLPRKGFLVTAHAPNVLEAVAGARCWIDTYGADPAAHWRVTEAEFGADGVVFTAAHKDVVFGRFRSPLIGRHNLANTLAVIGLCQRLGLAPEAIAPGLASFRGVKRRQEVVGEAGGVLVMDDFAHHPTAIRETLAGLRLRYPQRRLWAVFEPRSATSRRNIFQADLPRAFADADRVVLADPFAADRLPPEQRLDPEWVVQELRARGRRADYWPAAELIVRRMLEELAPGDLVCIMSSGGFDGIHGKLLAGLRARAPHA